MIDTNVKMENKQVTNRSFKLILINNKATQTGTTVSNITHLACFYSIMQPQNQKEVRVKTDVYWSQVRKKGARNGQIGMTKKVIEEI